jgi:hypothetical protein
MTRIALPTGLEMHNMQIGSQMERYSCGDKILGIRRFVDVVFRCMELAE